MMEALKPCPFCGAEPFMQEHAPHTHSGFLKDAGIPDHPGSWTIECPTTNCCGTIADTRDAAVDAWNRRAAPAAPAPSAPAVSDLPPLPESKFCAWAQHGQVVNAFPHGVGDKSIWDRDGYWSAIGYDRAPLFTADQMREYAQAAIAALSPQAGKREWISVEDRLPEVGDWVNVLVDREEGDFFDRNGKPRYSVHGAQLRYVDSEGFAEWQRWQMSDGGPMGSLRLVTHWQPLPEPPVAALNAKEER